ncbi:hypothetical protein HOK51_06670 [Candidatus Woesearchaeota archaeon]|jgi:tRNA U34 5-methylaminomethyl-2-thiouridine-forming methyltransferase MnmC|nr:hypothetical protein [Candidatus Woesearchaeota archaeon]MBT6519507.1 hypothetical protein [Candidatus Woesearchaeota archaeon]MBT7367416.1 hypothetical protein [Candidatus Woesearchaeota archaeon]
MQPNITPLKTSDDSITFHNSDVDETYHSKSGAIEESLKKFIQPSNLNKLRRAVILDFCFGIGYNSACAIDNFQGDEIEIIALENDENILNKIPDLNPDFKNFKIIKELIKNNENRQIKILNTPINQDNRPDIPLKITLIVDDAKNTLKDLPDNFFDIIYFDPFSPKKCPDLWTEDVFKEIARVMKKGANLTTYSCASQVRKNMIAANLLPKDGPIVGRRAPSTIAIKE